MFPFTLKLDVDCDNVNENEDEDYDEHDEIITNKKTNEELSVQKKEYMDGRTIEIKRGAKEKKIATES